MMKTKKYILWAFACILILNTASALASDTLSLPRWPLDILTYPEREARLNFFLETKSFQFQETSFSKQKASCEADLKKLKQKEYKILSPKHAFRHSDMEQVTLHACGPEVENIYIPQVQAENYEHKINPQYNREYYDLSKYFNGQEVWGLFAEGGVLEYAPQNQKICDSQKGFKKFSFSKGVVFKNKSCEIIIGPDIRAAPRLAYTSINGNSFPYYSSPSFYAFIDMDDNLFRLSMSVRSSWDNFKDVLADKRTDIFLDNVTKNFSCLFVTSDLIQE